MGESFQLPKHLQLLSCRLMKVAAGRCPRLIVTMPPGHAKSTLSSKLFPAWILGRWPKKRIAIVSHEQDFAASFSAYARDLLAEYGPSVFGVEVSPKVNARDHWEVKTVSPDGKGGLHLGGCCYAVGVGGALTGKRLDLLVVDDLVKNEDDVRTSYRRQKTWTWFQTVANTRMEPGGAIVVVMTRWHEEDIVGLCLQNMRDGVEHWDVVDLPALAYEGVPDPLDRQPGDPLWPERFDRDALLKTKQVMSSHGGHYWEALYQQRPKPPGGTLFSTRHFRYFWRDGSDFVLCAPDGTEERVAEAECWQFSTSDLAISQKASADYFVTAVWAVTPKKQLLLLEVYRDRLQGPDQVEYIVRLHQRLDLRISLIEDVAYQAILPQILQRRGVRAEGVKVHKDKLARAQGPAAWIKGGSMYFLRGAPWLADFEDELRGFPEGAAHDDQVDNASMAVEKLSARAASFAGGLGRAITMRRR